MKDRVQSIERAIDILMALADGPKTLTEVTRATGLSKGTTFRLLASLNYENLVVKDGGRNSYVLGPGFLRLLHGVTQGIGAISAVARPALIELWEETGETVTIHVPIGIERICIEELPSQAPIRYTSTIGATAPLHVGSAGRILLAFTEPRELERILGSLPLERIAAGTITDPQELRAEVEAIRERGYAMSAGERVEGASAISVPIFGRPGFIAALSVLGPDFRLTHERRMEHLPKLRATAQTIGASLVETGRAGLTDAAEAATG